MEINGKIRKIRKIKIKKSDIEDKKIKVKTTSKNNGQKIEMFYLHTNRNIVYPHHGERTK